MTELKSYLSWYKWQVSYVSNISPSNGQTELQMHQQVKSESEEESLAHS